ncbi:hypothetical protein B0H66DRAFT_527742 [Apodospora peruviana]|uniref:Uncharacterized protein n=1 Tax=Apodospora peruviana TaxID=516989 RepID=A0AAE0ISC1_9PEZI|nr:hypothetical protein B0H66DRAFT_527742 [Apodospora peruviana]
MHKLTDWLSTSEPSAQALKQHKKDAFQKAGISSKDSEASAKLHAPIGDIPAGAIKPTTGPSPEEVAKKRAEERRKLKQSLGDDVSGSASLKSPSSSGYSSTSSPKGSVSVPLDGFPFDGWSR